MGCFDLYCFICGNSCYDVDFNELENIDISKQERNNINKSIKWLRKCTVLLANNKVIHNCFDSNCSGVFSQTKKKSNSTELFDCTGNKNKFTTYFSNITNSGIFLHDDCWKFVMKKYGIKLEYKNIPVLNLYEGRNIMYGRVCTEDNVNYGAITKYWSQYMNYEKMFLDDNIWMTYSPLNNSKNNSKNIVRIKKIIKQLNLKKIDRPSPSISATFFRNGYIKIGNNNKFWIIANRKWKEIKEEVVEKKYNNLKINDSIISNIISNINNIPQIGSYNNKMIFIKNYSYNNKNKKFNIEFIGSSSEINRLNGYFV